MKYAACVYLGRDPVTGKERRQWKRFSSRKEAETYVAGVVQHLAGGGFVTTNTRLTLAEFLRQWLTDYAKGNVAPTTLQRYEETIRVHLVPGLGHVRLTRLNPQFIQSYLTKKLESGLSPTTVLHHHRLLHEVLRHAVKWGLIVRNPTEMVDPPRRERKEMHVWDEEQVRLFLAEAKRSSPYYPLYLAALMTGMRQGELLGLRWQDVDFVTGRATIQQTMYRLAGSKKEGRKTQILFKTPKTPLSRRSLPIPDVLVAELRRVREQQAEHRSLFGGHYEDHALVFCQPNGKPLRANNIVRRDFKRVSKRAKVPTIRFHDLRHCHATLLLKQGVNPKVVQERLGHSTPAFTLSVYSHVLPGMQEEAIKDLESRLLG